MQEERVTRVEEPTGDTHTYTTVVTDRPKRGGGLLIIVLVLAIVAAIGIWAVGRFAGPETAKDNAVANAANEVGAAANKIGDAAQDTASAAKDAVN